MYLYRTVVVERWPITMVKFWWEFPGLLGRMPEVADRVFFGTGAVKSSNQIEEAEPVPSVVHFVITCT